MTIITDWTADKAARLTKANLGFDHTLHERPMFNDEGLISLLDRYPRDKLGVFTMGHDPVDWQSWRRGSAGDLSGEDLLRAAQSSAGAAVGDGAGDGAALADANGDGAGAALALPDGFAALLADAAAAGCSSSPGNFIAQSLTQTS